jgi:hypothetical protein
MVPCHCQALFDACLEVATKPIDSVLMASRARALVDYKVQSIIGATEKRREKVAVCRDIGDLSQRGELGAVYQGWI